MAKDSVVVDDGVLMCPCGGHCLHHVMEAIVCRHEDSPGRLVLVCASGDVRTYGGIDCGFHGRRDEVRVLFTCEFCDRFSCLLVVQHKGSTLVSWGRMSDFLAGFPDLARAEIRDALAKTAGFAATASIENM